MVVLAVIAYRKWDFRAADVSMAFLRSGPLKRETYAELPDRVDGKRRLGVPETIVRDEYRL